MEVIKKMMIEELIEARQKPEIIEYVRQAIESPIGFFANETQEVKDLLKSSWEGINAFTGLVLPSEVIFGMYKFVMMVVTAAEIRKAFEQQIEEALARSKME